MKRIGLVLLISTAVLAFTACSGGKGNIKINEKNFQDEKFRTIVQSFDLDNDGKLSQSECESVTVIGVDGAADLKGLEYFTNISELEIINSSLTNVDFSSFKHLKTADIQGSYASLDLSSNMELETLNCFSKSLKELKVPQTSTLKYLDCDYGQLTELDLSGCTGLEYISLSDNKIKELDVSNCSELTKLFCDDNELTVLNISGCFKLTELHCEKNMLTELNLSACADLHSLVCMENKLTSLDVLIVPNLKSCSAGQII